MASLEEEASHPLNWEYIVFNRRERDSEGVGVALAIYRLEGVGLKRLFDPSVFDPHGCNIGSVYDPQARKYITPTEAAINFLKEREIGEVVSVRRTRDFFGVPHGCCFLSDFVDSEGALTEWVKYETVYSDSDEYRMLDSAGIKVRVFDEDKRMFI